MRTLLAAILFCASACAQFVVPTNHSNYREHGTNLVDQNASGFAAPATVSFSFQDTGTSGGSIGSVTNGTLVATKNSTAPYLRVYNSAGLVFTDQTNTVPVTMGPLGVSTPVIDANGQVCMADQLKFVCFSSTGAVLINTAFVFGTNAPAVSAFSLIPSSDGSKITILGGGPVISICMSTCGSYTAGQQIGAALYVYLATAPQTGTYQNYYQDTNDACSISDVIFFDGQRGTCGTTGCSIAAVAQPNNAITAVQITNTGPIEIAQSALYDGPSQASPSCNNGNVYSDSGNGGAGTVAPCNSSSTVTPCIVAFSTTPSGTTLPAVCSTSGQPGVVAPSSTGTSYAYSYTLGKIIAHYGGQNSVYLINPADCSIAGTWNVASLATVCAPNCHIGSEQEIVPCPTGTDECMLVSITRNSGNYPSVVVLLDLTACGTAAATCPTAPIWSYTEPINGSTNNSTQGQIVVFTGGGETRVGFTSQNNLGTQNAGWTMLTSYSGANAQTQGSGRTAGSVSVR